jgi:hypothetical protein
MSQTTTIKVGESAKTITLLEGKALILTGAASTSGVAYLLDPVLGGTNSSRSWTVGVGSLAPIGPYENTQRIRVACAAGSIDATVQDAVLTVSTVAPGGGLWHASGALPDSVPVVVALGGTANSVYRVSVNPIAGDSVLVESGTSAAGPWTAWPNASVGVPDNSTWYPGAPTATHMRFTRTAGSGTTSRYYVDEISN